MEKFFFWFTIDKHYIETWIRMKFELEKNISEFTLTIVIDRFLLGQRQWLSGFFFEGEHNENSESNKWISNMRSKQTQEKKQIATQTAQSNLKNLFRSFFNRKLFFSLILFGLSWWEPMATNWPQINDQPNTQNPQAWKP